MHVAGEEIGLILQELTLYTHDTKSCRTRRGSLIRLISFPK